MTVQARLRKLLKRLAASPMKKQEFLLAQVLARLLFLGPEIAVPLLFGALVFGVPIRGSIFNIGVVVAGRCADVQRDRSAARQPGADVRSDLRSDEPVDACRCGCSAACSFPRRTFQTAMQPVIQALPLTALVDALRAVVLEGASLAEIRIELLTLMTWAIATFAIGLRIFKWR